MADALNVIRKQARDAAEKVGGGLNRTTKGRLTPDMVTIFGLLMHVPTAWFIASGHFLWAAGFLVVFGLFDTLDGGLARAQGKTSVRGMLLDASTDRMKEVLLYSGAAYWLALHQSAQAAAWATAACGASICVSYVKAKGEAAIAASSHKIPHATLNRLFADGLLTFELRMAVLVVGLLFDQLAPAVLVVAVLAAVTAVQRLIRISRQL
jgi:phosphatidylglycerophosphate synthase